MVYEATHFCAAQSHRSHTSKEIWIGIKYIWSVVYFGPPDYLVVDQGAAYTSKDLKESSEVYRVKLDEASVEKSGAITLFERYHALSRLVW